MLPRISVTRPVAVTVCLVALLAMGLVSYVRVSLQAFATGLDHPQIWVSVSTQQDTSPHEKDEEIGRPMVEHFRTLKDLREFWVTSGVYSTYAGLHFRKGVDMSEVYNRVAERVERLRLALPEEFQDKIHIWKYNSDSDEQILWTAVALPPHVRDPYEAMQSLVKTRLERLDGVANVDIRGVSQKMLFIEVDQERLQTRSVSAYELVNTLRSDNFQMSGGYVHEGGRKFYVRSLARYGSLDELRNIPLNTSDNVVRLAEVADVFFKVPLRYWRQRIDGLPAVALGVFRERGANIVEVCDLVQAELTKIQAETDFKFNTFFSQGKLIKESVQNLQKTAFWGGLFAALVLLFFLRSARMTALITLTIPVCVMIAVTVLYFMGWSLNLLTMVGLMVGVGMVVDNAIVIVENIHRVRAKGEDPHEASIHGAGEVALAITMATLTTVVVFLPLMVMNGDADLSFFLSKIGVPIVVVLLGSLFVALIFVPLAAKRFGGSPAKVEPKSIRWTREGYARGLAWTLTHRRDTILIITTLFATILYPIEMVKKSDSWRGIVNSVRIVVYPPKFLTWEELSDIGTVMEDFLESRRELYGIRNVHLSYRRTGKGRLFFNVVLEEEENRQWWYQAYRGLRKGIGNPLDSRMDRKAVIEDMNKTVPRFVGHDVVVESGSIGDSYVHIAMWGDDLETLADLRSQAELRVKTLPSVTGITSDVERGDDEVQVFLKRERMSRYGISPQIAARSIAYQLAGVDLPRYRSDEREVDVWLALGNEDRRTLNQLKGFTFQSESGEKIALSAFASFKVRKGDMTVRRRGGKIRLLLKMYTTKDDLKGFYEEIDRVMEGLKMPQGYSWDKGERYERFKESEEMMKFAVIMAVTCVFFLMGVLFESLILPFSVLICIPFAFLGVYWTLCLTDTVMDRMAQVGVIVLIGVVVNNAIVLVDMINRLRIEGKDRMEAILDACTHRFRPILMTTFTTVFGLMPMSLASNTLMGVPYSSMGRAMMGGQLCAMLLTLFVVPLFYTYFDDLRMALRRIVVVALSQPRGASYWAAHAGD